MTDLQHLIYLNAYMHLNMATYGCRVNFNLSYLDCSNISTH